MDINILPKACLAYETPADSENPPEDPANTELGTNARSGKKQHKCKGKKTWSKSAGAASSAYKTSPIHKNQTPRINAALTKQVAQDLHLSSDGSDSENPEETNKDTPAVGNSQPLTGTTQTQSGAKLPVAPAPDATTPTAPPEEDPDTERTADPTQEEGEDAGQPPGQPTIQVTTPVMADSTEGMKPQPTVMPSVPGADTTSPSPATTKVAMPPGLPQQPVTPNPSLAPPVPPGIVLVKAGFQTQVADRSMAHLAQSLAVAQAGGNPQARSFSIGSIRIMGCMPGI